MPWRPASPPHTTMQRLDPKWLSSIIPEDCHGYATPQEIRAGSGRNKKLQANIKPSIYVKGHRDYETFRYNTWIEFCIHTGEGWSLVCELVPTRLHDLFQFHGCLRRELRHIWSVSVHHPGTYRFWTAWKYCQQCCQRCLWFKVDYCNCTPIRFVSIMQWVNFQKCSALVDDRWRRLWWRWWRRSRWWKYDNNNNNNIILKPCANGLFSDMISQIRIPNPYISEVSVLRRCGFFQFSGGMWVTVPRRTLFTEFDWEYCFHLANPKSEIWMVINKSRKMDRFGSVLWVNGSLIFSIDRRACAHYCKCTLYEVLIIDIVPRKTRKSEFQLWESLSTLGQLREPAYREWLGKKLNLQKATNGCTLSRLSLSNLLWRPTQLHLKVKRGGWWAKKVALLFQSTIDIHIQKPAAMCSVASLPLLTKLRRLAFCAFIVKNIPNLTYTKGGAWFVGNNEIRFIADSWTQCG